MCSSAVSLAAASAVLAHGQTPARWIAFAPPDAGFSVLVPSAVETDPAHPGQFGAKVGDATFLVEVDLLDAAIRKALASGDRTTIDKYLDTMRDGFVKGLEATPRSTSSADFDGHPCRFFSFEGVHDKVPFRGTQRIVLTSDRMYLVAALGPASDLKPADVDRFHASFKLAAVAATRVDWRAVTFTDAVCARIPPVAVAFEMPAAYVGRAVGSSAEAGCLWGAKEDLDRVTADPTQGDFTSLRRGVFRARLSTNVVNSPDTGVFDAMDGAGEAGIRATLEKTGARLTTWKKRTIAGLPALEIVADLGRDRVYMLYLGNTHFISNAMLVNYFPATPRTAADDEIWAHFVAAIAPAKAGR